MILIFFLSKMVKQKLLVNKTNMLKLRSIERNALAISSMSYVHCIVITNDAGMG